MLEITPRVNYQQSGCSSAAITTLYAYSELPLETPTLVVFATMKRVGGLIIFVVTFTAALLQLSDAADAGNAPEQRTEGELMKSLDGGWKRFAGKPA